MKISVDPKTYLLYKIRSIKCIRFLEDFLSLGQLQGPQEFLVELLNCFNSDFKIKLTIFPFLSDFHLLNFGNYFKLWAYLNLKKPKKVFLRLDGIGFEGFSSSSSEYFKISNELSLLISRSNNLIFQSFFSKDVFCNTYKINQEFNIIYNGANDIPLLNKVEQNTYQSIKSNLPDDYYVVAGRNIPRKRITQVIDIFANFNLGNLVILSDIPFNNQINSSQLHYLGLIKSPICRHIINQSKALIHTDCYDWCPNLVVNAIYDQVPIICSNFGGTPELVKNSGIILDEFPLDLNHSIESINYVKSIPLKASLIIDAITNLSDFEIPCIRSDLSIKRCASKYLEFISKN